MKTLKKIVLVTPVMCIIAIVINLETSTVHSNSGAAPFGHTGAPGEQTCAKSGCHSTFSEIDTAGWITSDIPAAGYISGQTYTINASVSQQGISKFGFSVTNQDASGDFQGTLIATSATQINGSGSYITHRSSSLSGNNSKTWTFTWTAPSVGTGNITFYGAFNAADGFGDKPGDQIYTSSLVVQESAVNSVESFDTKELSIGPNPSIDQITVISPFNIQFYKIVDLNGKLVDFGNPASDLFNIPMSNLKGTYYLQLEGNQAEVLIKKLISY